MDLSFVKTFMFQDFFRSLLGGMLLFAAGFFLLFWSYVSVKHRIAGTRINWTRTVMAALCLGYLMGLFSLTLEIPTLLENGLHFNLNDYNLVPFREIDRWFHNQDSTHSIINFWGNIFVFSPIGFAVPLFKKYAHPIFAGTAWTCLLSCFIEFMQLFTPRATDIDDIILNTLGGLVGAMLFWLCSKLFPKLDAKLKTPMCARGTRAHA